MGDAEVGEGVDGVEEEEGDERCEEELGGG